MLSPWNARCSRQTPKSAFFPGNSRGNEFPSQCGKFVHFSGRIGRLKRFRFTLIGQDAVLL
jgi:hypothetical protein